MSVTTKMCVVCGTDVSGAKRVKDSRGNYFCEKCYAVKLAEKQGKAGGGSPAGMIDKPVMMAAEKPVEKAVEKPVEKKAVPLEAHNAHEEYDEYSVIPAVKPKEVTASGSMLGCSVCKKVLPEESVKNVGGDFVCTGCMAKREVSQRAGLKGSMVVPAGSMKAAAAEEKAKAVKPVVKGARAAEDDENPEKFVHTLQGGLLMCGLATLGVFVFMVAWQFLFPPERSMFEEGVSFGALELVVLGAVYWLLVMLKAGGLVASMFILDKIMGGVDFGYIGMALFKAVCAALILTVADLLTAWSGLGMIMWGGQMVLFALTFILLFKLDMFESFLLGVINLFMGIAMWIVVGIVALKLMASFG